MVETPIGLFNRCPRHQVCLLYTSYLAGNVAFWLGFNIVTLNIPPYVTVLLGGTEGDTAIYFGLVLAVALLLSLIHISREEEIKTMMTTSPEIAPEEALYITGNEYLSLPEIGRAGEIRSINVLHMDCLLYTSRCV